MKSRLPSAAELAEDRREGLGWDAIAAKRGWGRKKVYQIARDDPDFPRELMNFYKGRNVSTEEIREVIEDMHMDDAEAARHFGLNLEAFRRLRLRRGFTRGEQVANNARKTPEELAEAKRLIDEGYSFHAISTMTTVGERALAKHFPGQGFNRKQSAEAAVMGQKLARLSL